MLGKLHTSQALQHYVTLQRGKLVKLEEKKKTGKEGATEQSVLPFHLYWTPTAYISFEQKLFEQIF